VFQSRDERIQLKHPLINKPGEVKSKCSLALIGVAVLLSVETIITIAVLGPSLPGYLLFPYWKLARYLELGHAFIRVETLLIVLWIAGIVIKTSIIYYLISITIAQVWFGESIILVLLLPLINKPSEVKRKCSLALTAVALLLCVETIITIAVLGPDLPGYLLFPYWKLARYLEFGHAFIRVETLLIVLWIAGIVIKTSIVYYLASITIAQVFGAKTTRKVIIYVGFIFTGASTFLFSSTMQLNEILGKLWPLFAFAFEMIIPALILVTAIIRKKREG
jgi:hypothetical protein